MSLTEFEIKNAKPKEKAYSLSDGRGLILDVRPNGGKFWVARIWIDGKEKRRGLGTYPEINLKKARELNYETRKNPLTLKSKSAAFGDIAKEWMDKMVLPTKAPSYSRCINMSLNKHILPKLKSLPLEEITPGMILSICQAIADDGYLSAAARVRQFISQIFDYAIASDLIKINPAASISKALQSPPEVHYAAITGDAQIGALLQKIYSYDGELVKIAMKISAFTFCRPSEVRESRWEEFNLDNREWCIPAERTKMKREHIVPLSKQTIDILKELQGISGNKQWLFPSLRNNGRTISDGTIRVALRVMGYAKEEMTAHGFRAMASTTLNSYEWPADVIEAQLAHIDKNKIRRAYNRSMYMPQRIKMMQWWADYLDAVRTGRKVPKKPKVTINL